MKSKEEVKNRVCMHWNTAFRKGSQCNYGYTEEYCYIYLQGGTWRYCNTGTDRDQKQTDRDIQGQTRTSRDKHWQTGTSRDKKGQKGNVPACPCLSLLVPVCPCLVPACPCLSLGCSVGSIRLLQKQMISNVWKYLLVDTYLFSLNIPLPMSIICGGFPTNLLHFCNVISRPNNIQRK